ncbi:MAG: PH domain-containing protein [Arachnia propionica]|uniref:PH domain-containing protein n=1 Tax=Arachnia propionica TaxID=1750 RepID=UPI002705ED9C|nr:PH domain-containing protein [Arachnia propionica]
MTPFRCAPRSILAGLLGDLPKVLGLVVILFLGSTDSGGLTGVMFWVAQVALVLQVLARPVEWFDNRYRFIDAGIEHRSGILRRSVRSLPWDAVTAVDVSQNWAQRMLGVHQVHLTQEASPLSGITLRGIGADLVAEIRALVREAGQDTAQDPVPTEGPGVVEASEPGRETVTIHRATWKELLLIASVRGQAFLLGAGAVYSLWEFLDNLPAVTEHLDDISGVPTWGKLLLVTVLAVTFGVLSTIVKYNDFHVRIEDGQLVTTYGLIGRRDRRFDPGSVMGLVVQRNLLERLLGRARLGVLTRDRAVDLETNTVLPTLPLHTVEAVAREHFPDVVPSSPLAASPAQIGAAVVRLLVLIAVLASAGWLLWLTRPGPWTVGAVILVAWLGPLWLFTRAFTGFRLDASARVVVVRRSVVGEKITTIRTRCVHAIGTTMVAGRLFGAWFSTYAGSPERFWAFRVTPPEVARLRSRLLEGAEPVGDPCLNGPRD